MSNIELTGTLQKRHSKTHSIKWFMPFLKKTMKKSILLLLLLVFWEVLPRTGLVDRVFLPPLSEVLQTWWQLMLSGELTSHISASLARSVSGYFLAVLIGIPVGLMIGWYTLAGDLLNPVIEVFRNTAPLALLPVFTLILGIGETSKIAVVIYGCLWPILLNTTSGVRNVDPLLIKSAKSLGLSPFQIFQKVILPAAIPSIFIGLRLAASLSILVLIAAEMIGAKAGLGFLINYSQFSFQIPNMYAGIITISFIGYLINAVLIRIEKKFSNWKPQKE
jgi:NitT/TauT family transport system permease protein